MKIITNIKYKITLGIILFLFSGCNNFFHDLFPPDDNRILSFKVRGQVTDANIDQNSVHVLVENGTDIRSLLPEIKIPSKALIIPIALEYMEQAFPGIDVNKEIISLYQTQDIAGDLRDLIRSTPGFKVLPIDMPIDFSNPVKFIVISGQANMREYTVRVEVESIIPPGTVATPTASPAAGEVAGDTPVTEAAEKVI